MAKATKKSSPVVHHLKSVHVHHFPPAVDLVVGSPVTGGASETAAVAAAVPAKTTRKYQLDCAVEVIGILWPSGVPEDMPVVAVWRRIKRKINEQGNYSQTIPSRKTVGRALGRYK
jgi:hypothetical protein